MIADKRFCGQPTKFWAYIRIIGEQIGYTQRKEKRISAPRIIDIVSGLEKIGLSSRELMDDKGAVTKFGTAICEYLDFRARSLNEFVEPRLMDLDRAKGEFERLKKEYSPKCPLPMNKQRGEKRKPAYFTGIINMIIEHNSHGLPCDYDPRNLIRFTRDGCPVRTFARRIDGAFTSTNNPIAIWEIKEYYHTTTFGSRVADGVYETLLDGIEVEELSKNEKIKTKHYLMIDAHYTWWGCGRSYLCRIFDILHMGYIDEVLFGYEVIESLPSIVELWVSDSKQ